MFKISEGATFLGGRIKSIDNVIISSGFFFSVSRILFRYFQTRAAVYLSGVFLVTMPGNGGTQISSIKCDDIGYYIDDLFSCSLRFPNRKNMITRSVTVHRPRNPPGRSSSKVHKII